LNFHDDSPLPNLISQFTRTVYGLILYRHLTSPRLFAPQGKIPTRDSVIKAAAGRLPEEVGGRYRNSRMAASWLYRFWVIFLAGAAM
jgi:hypothetical protein